MHGTPDITPEFIARLAAELGGRVVALHPDSEHRKEIGIELDSPMLRLHIGYSWEARPKWRAYVMDCQGRSIHNSGHANFNPHRQLSDIAADLRRRVIDASREPLRRHLQARGTDDVKAQQRRQRIAQLEAIAGEPNKAGHYSNAVVYLPGLRIQNNYHLDNEHNISAEISVKRWETLVMIARLVAEDHQLDASTASP